MLLKVAMRKLFPWSITRLFKLKRKNVYKTFLIKPVKNIEKQGAF